MNPTVGELVGLEVNPGVKVAIGGQIDVQAAERVAFA
jgi:hypothetical protein